MAPPDLSFTVYVTAERLDSTTFRPRASAIRQEGRKYSTRLLELDEEVFFTRSAAIDYGKEKAAEILKKAHPQAEIRVTEKEEEND